MAVTDVEMAEGLALVMECSELVDLIRTRSGEATTALLLTILSAEERRTLVGHLRALPELRKLAKAPKGQVVWGWNA